MNKVLKHSPELLLGFVLLFLLIYRILICFNYSPEISVGETNNVWAALNIANGKLVYPNPENTPFEIFQYTPLSQLAIIGAAKVFNSQSDYYVYNVMVFGRLVSLLFNVLTCVFVYLLLFRILGAKRFLSIVAAVCTFGLLTHLSFSIRPDALSLLLTIVSVYLFSIAYFNSRRQYYFYCALLFSISFFSKQDSFSILSALGLMLLLKGKFIDLAFLSVSFFIPLSALLLVFHISFGEFSLLSISGGLANGFSIENAIAVLLRFLTYYTPILIVSIISCIWLAIRSLSDSKSLFLLLLVLVSFGIAAVTSVKFGAWMNYYTPFVLYSIVLIFYCIDKILKKAPSEKLMTVFVTLSLLYVTAFAYKQIYHYTAPFLKYTESKNVYDETNLAFSSFKKKVLENDFVLFTFDKRLKLLLYKNTIFPNTEYYHVSQFSLDGYDQLPVEKKIDIIIRDESIGESQFATLNYFRVSMDEYREQEQILNYMIYEYGR